MPDQPGKIDIPEKVYLRNVLILIQEELTLASGKRVPGAVLLALVYGCNHGAGDPMSTNLLKTAPKEARSIIESWFPGFKADVNPLRMVHDLLHHRTGDPAINRVLNALRLAALAGYGASGYSSFMDEDPDD